MTGEWIPAARDALLAGRLREAAAIADRCGGLGLPVEFHRHGLSLHVATATWCFENGRGRMGLGASFDDWGPDYARLFAERLLVTLPLLVHHHRKGREHGCIVLNLDDRGHAPGLAFCSNSDAHALIPDPDFMRSYGYRAVRDRLAAHPVAWETRRPVALWRGTPGGDLQHGWRRLPRIELCLRAKQTELAALFDVGLNEIGGWWSAGDYAEIAAADITRGWVAPEHFADCRVQIDIDGHSNAWGGFFQRLLSGSPVVKVASPGGFRQWYYHRLVPGRISSRPPPT